MGERGTSTSSPSGPPDPSGSPVGAAGGESTGLADLSASEARWQLMTGELSSVELLDACLARIEAVDPKVNAMVTRVAERARDEAAAADRVAARGRSIGPLHGLPVAIKDLQATEGVRTTLGSGEFADHVPDADAAIVAKIRAAGGIVVGKTNIPERSIGANTVNRLFGATGNPFDPTRTCGGSSGGSAVALATGMAPLATGSDHGGSLRIPACFNGVVGYRATPGVVPFEERSTPQTFYSVQGPMARSVDDVALLLSVVAQRGSRAPRDPMAYPLDAARLAELMPTDPGRLRIGWSEDLGGVLVSEPVRRAFRQRIEVLDRAVGLCEPVEVDLADAIDVDWRLRQDVFVTQYHAEVDGWDPGFNPNVRATYDSALATPMEAIARARRHQQELIHRFQALTDEYDAIVCPGVSVSPFPWAELYPTVIDGEPVENYMAWLTLTAAITVIGHPVVALPAGLDEFGMPFGLQVIGRTYADRRLLSVARALEEGLAADPLTARPAPDLAALARSTVDLTDVGDTLG
ncbi:MAG: amidase family protein [Actinomycetota bacterium]